MLMSAHVWPIFRKQTPNHVNHRFRPMKGTISGREEKTLMKLIVDADSDRVVGCHM